MITGSPETKLMMETLAYRVPLLSEWMLEPLGITRQAVQQLAQDLIIDVYHIPAVTPLGVSGPVFCWNPGEPLPDDGNQISQQLRDRWSGRAAQATQVYTLNPFAATLMGSSARRLSEPQHWDHDLLMGEVFAWYLWNARDEAERFVGEHRLPKAGHGIPDPDAFVCDDAGRMIKIVESGGRYSPEAVERLLIYATERSLMLEIW